MPCWASRWPATHLSFRETVESGDVDLDGLDEIADEDVGGLEESYDTFADDGVLADEEGTLSRSSRNCKSAADRGALKSIKLAAIYSKTGIQRKWDGWYQGLAALGYVDQTTEDLDPRNFAHLWTVEYCTVDFDGSPEVASGMLAVPGLGYGQDVDVVLYGHSTTTYRYDTATNLDPDITYEGIPTVLALVAGYEAEQTRGDIVLYPDGTGFGSSSIDRHRYFDEFTESASMLDFLDAAQEALPTFAVSRSGNVFLSGFSEGGNAALATARELQLRGTPAAGVITIAGALAIEDMIVEYYSLFDGVPEAMLFPAYQATTALDIGRLPIGTTVSDVFLDQVVYDAFDMTNEYGEVLNILAGAGALSFAGTFTTEFLEQQMLTPGSEYRTWMAENDETNDWCPAAGTPVVVTYAFDDFVVPPEFVEGWVNGWMANCPSANIELVGSVNGSVSPHDQFWNDSLFGLGAQFNAL